MEQNLKSKSISVSDIIKIALMAAIICLVTMLIKFPTQIGYTHLGDSMVFVAAILFGRKKGFLAAALGMMLADMLGGYFIWAPFTFIIKGVMAYIAGLIAYRSNYQGKNLYNNIFACVAAGIWMVAAYYLAGVIISCYILFKTATIQQALAFSLADIPGNTIEVLVGMVLALPLSKMLINKIK